MQQNNVVNDAVAENTVKNADPYALAQNPIFRNLQHKLIERTDERDRLRFVHQTFLPTHTLTVHY